MREPRATRGEVQWLPSREGEVRALVKETGAQGRLRQLELPSRASSTVYSSQFPGGRSGRGVVVS